jgi:hypothetical protein
MDHLNCGLIELKFAAGNGPAAMSFEGYGAVFGNVDAGGDLIEPGAFAGFLSGFWLRIIYPRMNSSKSWGCHQLMRRVQSSMEWIVQRRLRWLRSAIE